MNWCQKWWEYYPNPPFEVLDVVEDLLGFWDGEVLRHFVGCGVTSQVCSWLSPFFSGSFFERFVITDGVSGDV